MTTHNSERFSSEGSVANVEGVEKLIGKAKEILLQISGNQVPSVATQRRCLNLVEEALVKESGLSRSVAHDVAFHLTDWWGELVFLVALQMRPDRFTQEEIVEGVSLFLAHAPNHLAAGAKLFDLPVQDIFGVGPLEEPLEQEEDVGIG